MFINRDLSYPYLTSAGDLCERFFWKRLCINVLFGNIDRNIRQVFLWGINILTFPPKVWGAEPTPPSPPSREGSGVIYSYIHIFNLLKRAPHLPFWENFYTQKSAALPFFGKWGILKSLYSKERRSAVFLKMEYFVKSFFSKERRTVVVMPCSRKWSIFKHLHSEKSAALPCSRK